MEQYLNFALLVPVQLSTVTLRLGLTYFVAFVCGVGVIGCSSGSGAALATGRSAFLDTATQDTSVRLDQRYRYLKLTAFGRSVYPVLGFVDGSTEVWYTGQGEVVRLINGRLSDSAGLPIDWRAVHAPGAPDWSSVFAPAVRYERRRDVVKGSYSSVSDQVSVARISAPQSVVVANNLSSELIWFEESSSTNDPRFRVGTALYAVNMASVPPKVVYSEQCLGESLCLKMQEWSASQQSVFNEKATKP